MISSLTQSTISTNNQSQISITNWRETDNFEDKQQPEIPTANSSLQSTESEPRRIRIGDREKEDHCLRIIDEFAPTWRTATIREENLILTAETSE